MEFKDFADILKTHINVDADDDVFFMEIFDQYLRVPTDAELRKLEDSARLKQQKTGKHVEPEHWNPFDGIGKDAQERLFRGQRPFQIPRLKKPIQGAMTTASPHTSTVRKRSRRPHRGRFLSANPQFHQGANHRLCLSGLADTVHSESN